jgi:hypothetical protein
MIKNNNHSIKASKKNKFIFILSGILLLALTTIGYVIFRNLQSGEFTLPFDTHVLTYDVTLSENAQFDLPQYHLEVSSNAEFKDVNFDTLKLDEILQSEGQYIDPNHQYLAYSFYMKNRGTVNVSIDYQFEITQLSPWMESNLRILIIKNDDSYYLYQSEVQSFEDKNSIISNVTPFVSNQYIFKDQNIELEVSEVAIYRVIIWLEQNNPEDESDKSGRLEARLSFEINKEPTIKFNQYSMSANLNRNLWFTIPDVFYVDFTLICNDSEH